jgi:hypothetical protein
MSSTILSIIQQFCYRVNIPAPTAIVGVSSPSEQQYLSLFKFIGDNLRNRPYQWPQLKRGYIFLTSTGVSNYQLPGDFYRILDSTQWDTTNQWPLAGPVSDFNMTIRDYAIVGLQTRKAYRLIGPTQYLYSTSPYTQRSQGWFQVSPAGENNTDELFMGYLSANWLWPKSWVASTSYAAGALVSGNGYTYRTAAGGTSGTTRPSHATGTASDGAVSWTVWNEPYPCDPSNTLLNDSDLCLLDEDIMIEGLVWAYARAKGQDFQERRQEWENSVKSAFSRFNGPQRISMADQMSTDDDLFPFTAPGSWAV